MILLLIPVVGLLLGVGLWVGLRGLNALSVPGGEPSSYRPPDQWSPQPSQPAARPYIPPSARSSEATRWSGWGDRVASIPQGLLMGVVVLCGIWILGWLILLVVGLSLLS